MVSKFKGRVNRWTRRALADLKEIAAFIGKDDPRAANALVQGFRNTASHLERQPNMGRIGELPGTREWVVHRNYLLTYRVGSETIDVLQVWHVARRRVS